MRRMIRDYVEVSDRVSLDDFIAQLVAIRDGLPEGAEAEIMMRGDEIFGRHLAIKFNRPPSQAEAECENRYRDAGAEVSCLRVAA